MELLVVLTGSLGQLSVCRGVEGAGRAVGCRDSDNGWVVSKRKHILS